MTNLKFKSLTYFSPYDYLAQANVLIMEMEKDMTSLQNSAVLFEVEVPKFEALHDCRR